MEHGISQMTGSRGDRVQPSAASLRQGFGVLVFPCQFSCHSCVPVMFEETMKRRSFSRCLHVLSAVAPLESDTYECVFVWERWRLLTAFLRLADPKRSHSGGFL